MTFYLFNIVAIYWVATLNIRGIVFLAVLLTLQKLYGGYSARYISILRSHIRPERFFDKCEVIFEEEKLPEERVMFTWTPHQVMCICKL